MKYLKKFNESTSDQEPFIFKSPDGLVDDIKEIFYILSDYGCELEYDESYDSELYIIVTPIEIERVFTGIDELINLRNRLNDGNDYIYVSKLIEVYSHLNQLKDERGGFEFKLYTDKTYNEVKKEIFEIQFDYDEQAIINDIGGKIYLNRDFIKSQLADNVPDDRVIKHSFYKCLESSFSFRFPLKKQYSPQPILDHFNLIMGEYFKFYLTKEEADDFEESGDYYYTLKGDLNKDLNPNMKIIV